MSIEAFILVGGRSSRLGRDKALERIGGKTLAERALDNVRESGIAEKIFFATGNEIEFAIEAAKLDAQFVFDSIQGRGPLGALYTALTNTSAEWVFILACDLPFVTPALIANLSRYIYGEHGGFGAIVPEQPDGRLQPLCAFYNVAAARPVVEEITGKPRPSPPMFEVVSLLNPRIVAPAEYDPVANSSAMYFRNINTEDDLSAARELEGEISG